MLAFHKENTVSLNSKCQLILSTNVLEYVVNIHIFVSYVYKEDIYDRIGQIYHLHLKQYFIVEQNDINFRYLC